MKTLFERINRDFEGRQEAVCRQLQAVCNQAKLPDLFRQFDKWAIVGGAVRDLLLSDQPEQCRLRIDFPDIDVAVDRPVHGSHFVNLGTDLFEGVSVHTNSFGGLKLESDLSGIVDVWSWESKKSKLAKSSLRRRLDRVDFGINAVAYLWPDNHLVIHPRWFDDLKNLVVEKLAIHSPKVQLQPIRACALAVKLAKLTHCRFDLGKSIREDMRRLVEGDADDVSVALNYLLDKIIQKRWCKDSADRFYREFNTALGRKNSEADGRLRSLVASRLGPCLPKRKTFRHPRMETMISSSIIPSLITID